MSVSNQESSITPIVTPNLAPLSSRVKSAPQLNDIERQVHEFELSLATHCTTHETPHTLFAPMHYEPGYAYPLIVWLHGAGAAAERQLMKIMPLVSMRNYVAVAPRGLCVEEQALSAATSYDMAGSRFPQQPGHAKKERLFYHWSDSETGLNVAQQRVFDCVQIASEKCNIAKRRVFLAGFGEGGTMAFRVAMQFPQYFAGVISLCGAFPQGKLPLGQLQAVRSMPCLMSVGRDSKSFSPTDAAKQMMLFHTAGMSVTVRQYPCRQELSTQMLEDVNRWIMEKIGNLPR